MLAGASFGSFYQMTTTARRLDDRQEFDATEPSAARSLAPNGVLRLPVHPVAAAAISAVMAGGVCARRTEGGWRDTRRGQVLFERADARGGRIEVSFGGLRNDRAWREVEAMSALTLDVLICLLARLADGPAAPVCADMILRAKAMEGRDAPGDLDAQIELELERLLRLTVTVFAGEGLGRNAGASLPRQSLFERDDTPAAPPHAMRLRLGGWTGAERTTCDVPAALLRLDHRRTHGAYCLAKKLGVGLSLAFGALPAPHQFEETIGALLQATGELPDRRVTGMARTGRLHDRFDEAAQMLKRMELFDIRPPERSTPAQRRGWIKGWLSWELVVTRLEPADAGAA
jgi:hypothetical protein